MYEIGTKFVKMEYKIFIDIIYYLPKSKRSIKSVFVASHQKDKEGEEISTFHD